MRTKLLVSAAFFLTACGFEGLDIGKISKDENNRQLTPTKVPVQLIDMSGSFSLAPADAYNLSLDGCVSGFTATATEATVGGLQVYKFDQNCLAKLTSFQTGGITYAATNPGATDFTTWLAGDNATFTDAGGTNSIGVSVVTQLDNPVSGTEPIQYAFSVAVAGTGNTVADTTVGASHTVTVAGDNPPDVEVFANAFVGMTATGAGQFTFDMECQAAIAGNLCSGDDMTAWTWLLVEDTYGGSPTLTDLDALTPAGTGVVSGAINVNGGITSPTLNGPDQIHLKPNMILVIKNGVSYKYFNVDVTVLPAVQ